MIEVYQIAENNIDHQFDVYIDVVNFCAEKNLSTTDIVTKNVEIPPQQEIIPRILQLAHNDYKNWKYNLEKFDFRKQLEEGCHLDKNVVMGSNGRPMQSIYTFEGILIARIDFSFVFENNKFIRRTETLYYYYDDETTTEGFIISDEKYNPEILYQFNQTKKENIRARENILFLLESQLEKDFTDKEDDIDLFFTEYDKNFGSWIRFGNLTIILDRMNTEESQILVDLFNTFYIFDENQLNTTIKDYILFTLSLN